MSVKTKIKIARVKYLTNQFYEKAKKISFAVVVFQYLVAFGWMTLEHNNMLEWVKPQKTIIVVNKAQAKTSEVIKIKSDFKKTSENNVSEIANIIWTLESSKGLNNYSKCEAIGKYNGIGFGIPGDGTYMCFNSHEEEMKQLNKWIKEHKSQGITDDQMLCHYNIGSKKDGTIPNECIYSINARNLGLKK